MFAKSCLTALTILLSPVVANAEHSEHIDACLVGLWTPDLEDLAHVFGDQMRASDVQVNGDVRMRVYENGNASISIEDLVFDLTIPDIPPMTITLNGGSDHHFRTYGVRKIEITPTDVDIVASADVLGTAMTIPFGTGVTAWEGGTAEYGCSPGSISFDTLDPGKFPRHWVHLDPS